MTLARARSKGPVVPLLESTMGGRLDEIVARVRGYGVMQGYRDDTGKDRGDDRRRRLAALRDLGEMDAGGYVKITGRITDMNFPMTVTGKTRKLVMRDRYAGELGLSG